MRPARCSERIVAERDGGADPQAVGEDALQEVGRRDGPHVEERVPPARSRVLRFGHVAAGRGVETAALALDVEGGHHGEDDLAVLYGDHASGRERTPVPVTVHLQDDGKVAPSGPQEVAVEGVGQPAGFDRGRGGEQALCRHLAPEEGAARPVVGVPAAEEVLVDPLECQERMQVVGEVHAQECAAERRGGKWAECSPPRGLDRPVMPRDIRELRNDPEAYAAELRRRWGGLLSYRYIGRNWSSMNLGPADNTVTLRSDMRSPTGAILLAVLGIAAPEGGGRSDLEAVPNPVIHSCQILDPGRDVQRIEVVSEVLKHGRQMGYSRSRIVDADEPGRVLALTQGQGVSIGTPPAGLEKMPLEPIVIEDSPGLPPLWQVFGATRRSNGHWALPVLSSEVASPDAALHLGPQFVLLETAAFDVVAEAAGH